MFAWSDAIEKYKTAKQEGESSKSQCEMLGREINSIKEENKQLKAAAERLAVLEAEMAEESR